MTASNKYRLESLEDLRKAREARLNSDKCEICDARKATVELETGMEICKQCFNREFK